jgi:hypothetical protein
MFILSIFKLPIEAVCAVWNSLDCTKLLNLRETWNRNQIVCTKLIKQSSSTMESKGLHVCQVNVTRNNLGGCCMTSPRAVGCGVLVTTLCFCDVTGYRLIVILIVGYISQGYHSVVKVFDDNLLTNFSMALNLLHSKAWLPCQRQNS